MFRHCRLSYFFVVYFHYFAIAAAFIFIFHYCLLMPLAAFHFFDSRCRLRAITLSMRRRHS